MGTFGAIFACIWLVYMGGFWLAVPLIAGFWLWMLIDVLTKQTEDKMVWLLVVLLLGPLGALLHYLMARKKRLSGEVATA